MDGNAGACDRSLAILEAQTVERAQFFLLALLAWVLDYEIKRGGSCVVGILGIVMLLLWRRGEAR